MPCASSTTSDAVFGHNPHAPCGLRRRGGISRVVAPPRYARYRLRRAALDLPPRRSQRDLPGFFSNLLEEAEAKPGQRVPRELALDGVETRAKQARLQVELRVVRRSAGRALSRCEATAQCVRVLRKRAEVGASQPPCAPTSAYALVTVTASLGVDALCDHASRGALDDE